MNSDDTIITDRDTIPCPTPGCERPTYDQMQRMFARNAHDKTDRKVAAARATTLSIRDQRALVAYGLPMNLPATTNNRTSIGVQIAEEKRS